MYVPLPLHLFDQNLPNQPMCPICDDIILETKSKKGQDSIMCEGECKTWLHQGCAGLSKKRFLALRESSESFECVSCCLKAHTEQIHDLWNDIKLLKDELSKLQSTRSTGSICPEATSLSAASVHESSPSALRRIALRLVPTATLMIGNSMSLFLGFMSVRKVFTTSKD